MSVAPWALMFGPPLLPDVVVVGIDGAVTDGGVVVVGVCVVGSWQTSDGLVWGVDSNMRALGPRLM
ncbi:hypothetical protein QNM97_10415 [Gordonia sp. L191]|uniref:hypothetical protein n=1 Tax=Gordonia sp. L191 TaxID=2982699 RepID=UPI0024BFF885|nr:hypothetical protein [Gordonia sp. L191]WHU49347.1 hypothetical protein QNM97_10415 [Gordonia sp. L191]